MKLSVTRDDGDRRVVTSDCSSLAAHPASGGWWHVTDKDGELVAGWVPGEFVRKLLSGEVKAGEVRHVPTAADLDEIVKSLDWKDRVPFPVRFGSIRRGGCFLYYGRVWRKIRGRFALPDSEFGTGQVGWPIGLGVMVVPSNSGGK